MLHPCLLAAGRLCLVMALSAGVAAQAAEAEVDFAHEVAPILRQHCVGCHGGGEAKGGFSLNSRELLSGSGHVKVGAPEASYLLELIASDDPDQQMPPPDQPRVPEEAQQKLHHWIAQGMLWDEGFTFAPAVYDPPLQPRRPELPPAEPGRDHLVDRLVDAYLREHAVETPAEIDDATFLRRVTLDLVGLLPEPQTLQEFLADAAPDKRARMIDRLLADEIAYADHWISFFNDLLRNDYSGTGFITKGRTQISGWLYEALRNNRPFNVMAHELIAPPTEASRGYIDGIRWRGEVSAGQTVEIQFAQSIAQSFLGINLKCASCHDSFVDRWTLEDAYGLAAIYADEPLAIHRCDVPVGRQAQPRWLFPEIGDVDATAPREQRLVQLADLMTHRDNGRFTRTIVNRLWYKLMGRGIVHPLDAMQNEPWNADLLDTLAVYLADHQYDLKAVLRLIATSRAYQSATVVQPEESALESTYRGPVARRMTAEQFLDSVWQITAAAPAKIDAPVLRDGAAVARASLMKNDFLMKALGRPLREQIVSMRPSELSTLEAIHLSNGEAFAEALAHGASYLSERPWADRDQVIDHVFRFALSRPAHAAEAQAILDFLSPEPTPEEIEDLLWSIFMMPEFLLIR